MHGIIVVDDDAPVRVELQSMIDWEKEGYVFLGEADNGEKGLELILEHRPDIVITDIKMPVMDGLEMIRAAKMQYTGAKYVALTSFEEFGLLKTALRFGIADYLLKLELTPSTLLKTLESQKRLLLHKEENKDIYATSPVAKAANELSQILEGSLIPSNFNNLLNKASPLLDCTNLSAIAINFSLTHSRLSDRRALESAAFGIIKDITKNYCEGITFLAGEGLCIFVFTPRDDTDLQEMGTVIINMLKQYINIPSSVGIGMKTSTSDEINSIMKSAVDVVSEVFYNGFGSVITKNENLFYANIDTKVWTENFYKSLDLKDVTQLKKSFSLLHDMLDNRLSRDEAYNLCFTVASLTNSALKNKNKDYGIFSKSHYDIIGKAITSYDLKDWLKSYESKLIDFIDIIMGEESGGERIITEAKRYILENLNIQITLKMVADHMYISSGYLSHLFKKTTGISFIEHVTNIKMEKAKELLRTGKYKIYEVSDMLGYEYSNYFTKLFRKTTGLSPNEFISQDL